MPTGAVMVAFFFPGTQEWLLLLVLGILLFGRRLPEVGRQLGRTVNDLRRGFDSFKRELDSDGSIREARSSFREVQDAVRRPPPRYADPRNLLRDLTDEARSALGPGEQAQEPPKP